MRGTFLSVKFRQAAVRALIYGLPAAVILIPLLSFLLHSFWSVSGNNIVRQFTLKNYAGFIRSEIYLPLFFSSLGLCLAVSAIAIVHGYIVAYLIWRLSGRWRYILLLLTVVPLSMNYVVKIYALRGILGYNGYLNQLLVWTGLIEEPSRLLLFNRPAVLIAMAVIYLPYAVFPIFLSLERINPSLLSAAADLSARPGQAFRTIVLPLSLPGAIVAALFVMVLALGDFLTPQMVGGNRGFTFGSVVWSQFGMAYNWPLGAALAVILLVTTLTIIATSNFVSRRSRMG